MADAYLVAPCRFVKQARSRAVAGTASGTSRPAQEPALAAEKRRLLDVITEAIEARRSPAVPAQQALKRFAAGGDVHGVLLVDSLCDEWLAGPQERLAVATNLIRACETQGNRLVAETVIHWSKSQGIEPSRTICACMVRLAVTDLDVHGADLWLRRMRLCSHRFPTGFLRTVVTALHKSNDCLHRGQDVDLRRAAVVMEQLWLLWLLRNQVVVERTSARLVLTKTARDLFEVGVAPHTEVLEIIAQAARQAGLDMDQAVCGDGPGQAHAAAEAGAEAPAERRRREALYRSSGAVYRGRGR